MFVCLSDKISNLLTLLKRPVVFLRAPTHYHAQVKKMKKHGMKIGRNVSILHDTILDPSRPFLIEIGNNVTFAPRCHVLTHDASMCLFQNRTRIGKVKILDNCFIGAGSVILPGVTIGPNVVIGAGSVVAKTVPEGAVFAGNPAKRICGLAEFLQKHDRACTPANSFPRAKYHGRFVSRDDAERLGIYLDSRCGYRTHCLKD